MGKLAIPTPNSIGYVGCSNSTFAVRGYRNLGGLGIWNPLFNDKIYGGGVVYQWSYVGSAYWAQYYQDFLNAYGTPAAVWVNLCAANERESYSNVQKLFAILKAKTPNVPYYVSGLNAYSPPTLCGGITSWETTDAWAVQAVTDGLAQVGPSLGPLDASTVMPDNCHPNAAGELLLGQQLLDFFG